MDIWDIENCLESFNVIIDTREQPSERAERRYQCFSAPYRKQKLDYGDYTYNFTLPDGKELFEPNLNVAGHVVVERKADLNELSQCLCQSRDRFIKEFERAKNNNCKIYLLVENANWENLINGKYGTHFNANAYYASITSFMAKYNLNVIFCKAETSGTLIKNILYREAKYRLENGFYDNWRGTK